MLKSFFAYFFHLCKTNLAKKRNKFSKFADHQMPF